MNKAVSVLDCTLRDGGMMLNGSFRDKDSQAGFSEYVKHSIVKNIIDSGIEVIELGTVEKGVQQLNNFCYYENIEQVSEYIISENQSDTLYSVFFRGPDIPIEEIPDQNSNTIDIIRLSLRYSELSKSLNYCYELCKKGYLVSVQPIVTCRYDRKEIEYVLDAANDMQCYAVYIVDSYGSMFPSDISDYLSVFNDKLCKNIRIGFHGHDNMCMTLSNSIEMINKRNERSVILDSCLMGMGQGAGNLKTELIVAFLNRTMNSEYDINQIFHACEHIDSLHAEHSWGYSPSMMISALYETAYNYGIGMRDKYHYSLDLINNALSGISSDIKYRYTDDDLKKLVKDITK